MTNPAISILLTTFNGEAFLAEQLRSILDQRLADFELLIIDDGSTDATGRIVAELAAQDARISVLPATGNRGQKQRLRQLVRAARAPLVAIADQDDVWDAEKLAMLAGRIGEAGLALGRSELVDGDGKPLGRSLIENFGPPPVPGDRLSLLVRPLVSAHAALVRRDHIADEAFSRLQAFDWLISLDAAFGRGIVYVEGAVVRHRIHGANQSNAEGLRQPSRAERIGGALRFRRRERLSLLQRLEHLGHSEIIDETERRVFATAASLCQTWWFGACPGGSQDRLSALLRPLAGSEDDWRIFAAHLRLLTRSRFSPRAIAGGTRRLLLG